MTKFTPTNKKAAIPLIIILIGFLVGAYFVISSGYISTSSFIGSPDTIYKVNMGRLECLKDQSPEDSSTYIDKEKIIKCGEKYSVDECEVIVNCDKTGINGCGVFYSVCNFDGTGCNSKQRIDLSAQQSKSLEKLQNGQSYKFEQSILTINEEKMKVTLRVYPYRLYTFESGGKFLSSSSDCCLANQDDLQKNKFKGGDWKCLDKKGNNQWLNYFVDWSPVIGAKIYTDNGKEVICANNKLYELTRQILADNSFINIQGNPIRDVECCPHQSKNCVNFKFVLQKEAEKVEVGCTYDYQCENSGNPWISTQTKAKIEKCVSGKCQEQSINIECNSDARCRELYGNGYGCDLSYDNFGKCIKIGQIEQPRCGDGICQTGETNENCKEDCEIICPEGLKLVTIESKVNCIVGWPLYWGCDKQVEKKCTKDSVDYLRYILYVIIIIAVILILIKFLPMLRPTLKAIPVIGRIIP